MEGLTVVEYQRSVDLYRMARDLERVAPLSRGDWEEMETLSEKATPEQLFNAWTDATKDLDYC